MANNGLVNIRVINWHACADSGIVPIRGDVMLAGPTGSGKSTLMDALYSTLYVNYNHFNKAANANSKRDLRSYVRWKADEVNENGETVKYKRRNRVISYVLIEMVNDHGPVAIGAYYSSASDGANIDKTYFVIPNKRLENISPIDENKYPMDFKVFQSKYGGRGMQATKVQSEAKRLFAIAMGFRKDQVALYEAVGEGVAKTLALDVSEMRNVDLFIKKYILTENNLDIEDVEKTFNALAELRKQLEELEHRAIELDKIMKMVEKIEENERECKKREILFTVASYVSKKQSEENVASAINDGNNAISKYEEEIAEIEAKSDEYKEQRIMLKSSDITSTLSRLNTMKEDAESKLRECEMLRNNLERRLAELYAEIAKSGFGVDVAHFTTDNFSSNSNTLAECEATVDRLRQDLDEMLVQNRVEQSKLSDAINTLVEDNKALRSGSAIGRNVENAMNAIRIIDKCFNERGIDDNAQMVYQCIDFPDENKDWQPAIERMLGNSRFNIVVKPENSSIARRIVVENRLFGVEVLNSSALTESYRVSEGSACLLMTFNNAQVENYIKYRFGRIGALATCKDGVPDNKANYIGKDGTKYFYFATSIEDNKTYRCHVGEDARKRMIADNEEKIDELKREMAKLKQTEAAIGRVNEKARAVETYLPNVNNVVLRKIETLPVEIDELDENIRELVKNNDMAAIEERICIINTKIAECESVKRSISKSKDAVVNQVGRLEGDMEKIVNELSEIEPKHNEYQEKFPDEFKFAYEEYEAMFKDKRKTIKSVFDGLRSEINYLKNNHTAMNSKLSNIQENYCNTYNNVLSFGGMESIDEYRAEYQTVVVSGLPALKDKVVATQAEQSKAIKRTIVEHYKHNFVETERKIKDMNVTLRTATFGRRTYSLMAPVPMVSYERYYNMIANSSDDNDYKYTDDEYEEFYQFIRADANNLDYRNFIKMDVNVRIKEVGREKPVDKRLSETISTGSGGETQIALYILSALSLVSTFAADRSSGAMKLLLIDEAFDKMDQQTIESMMGYFRALGFNTILSAPDSKFDVIRKFMDTRIFVKNNLNGRAFNGAANTDRRFTSFTNRVVNA